LGDREIQVRNQEGNQQEKIQKIQNIKMEEKAIEQGIKKMMIETLKTQKATTQVKARAGVRAKKGTLKS
jgi:hypothetical protein